MRKGITILEMIIVMAVLLFVGMLMFKPIRNITRDIPRQHRDYQSNSIISKMLDELRKDVEASNGLTRYKGSTSAAADMLLIDSPKGIISYKFENNKVIRFCDKQDNTKHSDTRRTWDIPGGTFDWKLRTHKGKPAAIEISTGINRRTHSRVKTNLKNSHVIFLGTDSLGGKL